MRWKLIVLWSFRDLKRKWIIHITLILLTIVTLLLSMLLATHWLSAYAGKWEIKNSIDKPIDGWMVYDICYPTDDSAYTVFCQNAKKCLQYMVDSKVVERAGSFSSDMLIADEAVLPLKNLQNEKWKDKPLEGYLSDDFVTWMVDDFSILGDNLEMDKDVMKRYPGEDNYLILLGDALREIPIGTVYESENQGINYVVVGYLPKGYSFYREAVYSDDEFFNLDNTKNLDMSAVLLTQMDEPYCMGGMLYSSNGSSKEVRDKIIEIARQYHVELSVYSLDSILSRENRSAIALCKYAAPYILLMLSACCVIICAFYLIDIIGNQKKYGIYFAIGIGYRDIRKKLLIENGMRLLLAYAISLFWAYYTFAKLYEIKSLTIQTRKILYSGAIISSLSCVMIMLVVGIAIPMGVLKKKLPVDLIGSIQEID